MNEDELFALGGQYLDFGMFPTVYDNSFVVPVCGNRWQQQQQHLLPPTFSTAEKKRQERNAREKERSYRITKQIDELKSLLMSSGIKVSFAQHD